MKTIFGLFERYEDARSTVDDLMEMGLSEGEIDVLVQAEVAKEGMDLNLEKARVRATDQVGQKQVRGLDAFLGTQLPVSIPVIGEVYAAGDLATMLAKTAMPEGEGSLEGALVDYGVQRDAARTYRTSVQEGGFLFLVRADDERAAQVTDTMRRKGVHVYSYP
jgi:hypothetical protein